jgi:hypothetical protein
MFFSGLRPGAATSQAALSLEGPFSHPRVIQEARPLRLHGRAEPEAPVTA